MNAQQIVNALISRVEMNPDFPPDGRRILRDERMALQGAIATRIQQDETVSHFRARKGAAIRRQADEAVRVARMWGAEI